MDILAFLRPTSTSADTALEQAIAFVLRHRDARAARLSMTGDDHGPDRALAISWMPPRWWKAVTGRHRRDVPMVTVDRKYLELCVLSCAMMELKSGDLCVAGSEQFSDYRHQLVKLGGVCPAGRDLLSAGRHCGEPSAVCPGSPDADSRAIRTTDAAFPTNTALTITEGNPCSVG